MLRLAALLSLAMGLWLWGGPVAAQNDSEGWQDAGAPSGLRYKIIDNNVTALTKLSGSCGPFPPKLGPLGEISGQVIKAQFSDDAITILSVAVETADGSREDITIDPFILDSLPLSTRGWVEKGLQTMLHPGTQIHATVQGCGVSGHVQELYAVSLAGVSVSPTTTETSVNSPQSASIKVPLVMESGILKVPVTINGVITLNFVLDSGAADVSIPSDVVSTLVRSGSITAEDFLGKQVYVLADGSRVPSQTFRIRSLKVGARALENVTASIANAKGDLLLGQSFLSRFKGWSIDNDGQSLILR